MSSIEPDKHPEAFAEAIKGGLGAANNTLLFICSLAGVGLGLYAEFSSSATASAAGWVAICVWFLGISIALYLAGRSAGTKGYLARIGAGLTFARHNAAFAFFVLLLTSGAVLSTWSKSKSERASRESLDTVARDARTIKEAVTRHISPIEALTKLGYTTSSDDVCRAIQARNAEVTALFVTSGIVFENMVLPLGSGRSGLCIEPLLLDASRSPELTAVLEAVPISAADLNRYFASQLVNDVYESLQLTRLLAASGWRAAHELDKFEQQVVAARRNGTLELDLLDVRATPLMFAVWADNTAAVQALLSMGSDPDLGALIVVNAGGMRLVSITASPLEEAQRLGRTESLGLLKERNARNLLSKGEYRP